MSKNTEDFSTKLEAARQAAADAQERLSSAGNIFTKAVFLGNLVLKRLEVSVLSEIVEKS